MLEAGYELGSVSVSGSRAGSLWTGEDGEAHLVVGQDVVSNFGASNYDIPYDGEQVHDPGRGSDAVNLQDVFDRIDMAGEIGSLAMARKSELKAETPSGRRIAQLTIHREVEQR
jgi:hypothetical protein